MTKSLEQKIEDLTEEMNADSSYFGCVDANDFANHPKAGEMLKLLMKLHGYKNITTHGAKLLVNKISSTCGIMGHDGHLNILLSVAKD